MSEVVPIVSGYRAPKFHLRIPGWGPWYFDARLTEIPSPKLEGRVTATIGPWTLSGTVDPSASGSLLDVATVRVVAGAHGWTSDKARLKARTYHNDAGVKAKLIATDAAAECGEVIADFRARSSVGRHYPREAVLAARALEFAAGGVPWWVDFAGDTHVAPRDSAVLDVPMLDWDVTHRVATFAVDDLSGVFVGGVIRDRRLPDEQTIRELEVIVDDQAMTVRAWCGGTIASPGRFARAFRAAVAHVLPQKLFGLYHYQVVSRRIDGRLDLQKVKGGAALGDLPAVKVMPGIGGVEIEPTPGSRVAVQFLDGEPTEPRVTSFADSSDSAFVPQSITFLRGTRPLARVGDQVRVFISPGVPIPITGGVVMPGAPPVPAPFIPGTTILIPTSVYGVIYSGEPRLKA